MMKLILINLIFVLIVFSCSSPTVGDNKLNIDQKGISPAKTPKKGAIKNVMAVGKAKPKSIYWNYMKSRTGFEEKIINGIKKINTEFEPKVSKLKNQKKWFGKENLKTRQNIWKQKEMRIKKYLGEKRFLKWQIAVKGWSKKKIKNERQY